MENRARYALIGAFTIAAVLAVFAFVYWIQNAGGLGARTAYRVRFEGSVSGLLSGSSVLFNGVRVGEVTALDLDPEKPGVVMATIAVDRSAPVRSDTAVGMDFQGLTGAPVVTLTGGSPGAGTPTAANGEPPLLIAAPGAGQTLTQTASDTLHNLDKVIVDNAEPLHQAIGNLSTFTDVLSRNSARVDGILAGLERMTGGAAGAPPQPVYSFTVPADIPVCTKTADLQLVVPDPAALTGFSTNKIPVKGTPADPHAYDKGLLADTVPALLQAKVVEGLDNTRCFRSVTRTIEGLETDLQLALDLRDMAILAEPSPSANLDLSAKLVTRDGKILAATVLRETAALKAADTPSAAAALDEVFGKMIRKLAPWASSAAAGYKKPPPEPSEPPAP